MKKLLFLAVLILGAGLVLCSPAQAAAPIVQIDTSMGTILVRLDERKAPVTCANFLKYVKSGFYDGTIFHRSAEWIYRDLTIHSKDITKTDLEALLKEYEYRFGKRHRSGELFRVVILYRGRMQPHGSMAPAPVTLRRLVQGIYGRDIYVWQYKRVYAGICRPQDDIIAVVVKFRQVYMRVRVYHSAFFSFLR